MEPGQVRAPECDLHYLHSKSFLLLQRNMLARDLCLAQHTNMITHSCYDYSLWPYVISKVNRRYTFQGGSSGWPGWVILEFTAAFRTPIHLHDSPFPPWGHHPFPEPALFGQWLRSCDLLYRLNIDSLHNTHKLIQLRAYSLIYPLISPFLFRNLYCVDSFLEVRLPFPLVLFLQL